MSEQNLVEQKPEQKLPQQKPNPKKVDSIKILVENRKNSGIEPPSFSADVRTDIPLYNFGSGFTAEPLLPKATKPIFATHISHNNSNYILGIASSGNGNAPPGIEAGTPVALAGGEKVDIQKWTIVANPKF